VTNLRKIVSGDIVLTRFHPSFGAELRRFRPALVILGSSKSVDPRFVTIVPISTKKSLKSARVELRLPKSNYLKQESYALLWYPLTIDIRRVVGVLGTLTPARFAKAQEKFHKYFSQSLF
jgi:mRNA-degrading endonuclease toxin of MazEF toxin-antitoxin module